jgi:hypothetical protein
LQCIRAHRERRSGRPGEIASRTTDRDFVDIRRDHGAADLDERECVGAEPARQVVDFARAGELSNLPCPISGDLQRGRLFESLAGQPSAFRPFELPPGARAQFPEPRGGGDELRRQRALQAFDPLQRSKPRELVRTFHEHPIDARIEQFVRILARSEGHRACSGRRLVLAENAKGTRL